MNKEIQLLIIGAIISIVSTLIGLFAQTFIQYILNNKGHVKIYLKKVYSKVDSTSWGFSKNNLDMLFSVPLWIEFHNTKEKKEIVRNLNLQLYKNKERIINMVQISHFEKGSKIESFGNEGSYSFILEPTSIAKFDVFFSIKQSEVNSDFDEVKLSYYDSKAKYHEIPILKIDIPWKISHNAIDRDWIVLE